MFSEQKVTPKQLQQGDTALIPSLRRDRPELPDWRLNQHSGIVQRIHGSYCLDSNRSTTPGNIWDVLPEIYQRLLFS